MHDWFNPKVDNNENHALIFKFKKFKEETGENLFERIFKAIDDHDVYQDVCIRIMYQFLFEYEKTTHKETPNVKSETKESKVKEDLEILTELFFSIIVIKNLDYKVKIIQVIAVYWFTLSNDETNYEIFKQHAYESSSSDKHLSAFFQLSILLKEKSTYEFHQQFDNFLKASEKTYGDYFPFVINHQIKLLSIIAQRLNLLSTVNFIFNQFPSVGINSTILTSLQETALYKAFIVYPFQSDRLNKMVRCKDSLSASL